MKMLLSQQRYHCCRSILVARGTWTAGEVEDKQQKICRLMRQDQTSNLTIAQQHLAKTFKSQELQLVIGLIYCCVMRYIHYQLEQFRSEQPMSERKIEPIKLGGETVYI